MKESGDFMGVISDQGLIQKLSAQQNYEKKKWHFDQALRERINRKSEGFGHLQAKLDPYALVDDD